MDGIVTVSTAEALETARRPGSRGGAALRPVVGHQRGGGAQGDRARHPDLRRIVTVISDTGQRYLSGELFGEEVEVEEPERDHTLDPDTVGVEDRDRLSSSRSRAHGLSRSGGCHQP